MIRRRIVLAAVTFLSLAAATGAFAQTLTLGPAESPRTLDAQELSALAAETGTAADGSTYYKDIAVEGDGWRMQVPSLVAGINRGQRGTEEPTKVAAGITITDFDATPSTYIFNFSTPATLSGDVTAGASVAVSLLDGNVDGAAQASPVTDTPVVQVLVDNSPTDVSLLDDLLLVAGFGGQAVATQDSRGIPGLTESIPTPASTFGLRVTVLLSGGDTLALTTAAKAVEAGAATGTAASPATAEAGNAEEEIHVELKPAASPRGVSAEPIQKVTGTVAASNLSGSPQSFSVLIAMPASAAPAGVMGGSVAVLFTDGGFDGVGGVTNSPGFPGYRGFSNGELPELELLDTMSVTAAEAGQSQSLVVVEGLPGPSIAPGPAVDSQIGVQLRFQLSPGDTAALSALFVVGTPFCPLSPQACAGSFEKGSLVSNEKKTGKEKLVVALSRGSALTQTGFGNPLAGGGTAYDVCIYNQAGVLAGTVHVDRAGDSCGVKPCWKSAGALPPDGKGYIYADKAGSAGGAKSLKLLAGPKSKVKLVAKNKAKKNQVDLATGIVDALAGSSSVTVQVHGSDVASCYSATLDEVVIDDGVQFKAK